MSEIVENAARMMEMLPDSEKSFAYEFIKKLVLAWDPDFTKVTPEEAKQLEEAEQSGFVDEYDLELFNKAMAEYKENPVIHSLEDVERGLGLV